MLVSGSTSIKLTTALVNEIPAKSCTPIRNFEKLEINDLLENIRILLNYITSVRKRKIHKTLKKSSNHVLLVITFMDPEPIIQTAPLPNLAFVDAQNLHYGTTKCDVCAVTLGKELRAMKRADCICGLAWKVDLAKFRIYLKDNYNVSEAYYILGYVHDESDDLYKDIQKAGFIVLFKEHSQYAKSLKKGNVDTDIVFEIMKNLVDNKEFDKIVLVSGDGDYMKLIRYLISKDKFKKILHPNKKFASSLYKKLGSEYFDYLENLKTYIV